MFDTIGNIGAILTILEPKEVFDIRMGSMAVICFFGSQNQWYYGCELNRWY